MADITMRSPFANLRRVLDDWQDDDWRLGRLFPTLAAIGFPDDVLAVDVVESGGKYVVKASVPGFKREDISVDVGDGTLTISAKRSEEKEEKGERFVRRERYSGSTMRRIALPGITRESLVDATLKNGVIEISVAAAPSTQAKQVEIKEG